MAGEVLSAVSRLLGAFFMAGGAVKIHDGGTGIYKIAHDQIYVSVLIKKNALNFFRALFILKFQLKGR